MGRGWGVASIVMLVACVRSDLVPCDNGLACPVGFLCDEVHGGCITPDQIASCVDQQELAPCTDGVCRDGVCLAVGCGNARVDPGEVCDDGNLASADGCSADCASTESCGNGTVDPINRELCDAGDLLNHDGCDSRCLLESPGWMQLVQIPHPQVYDAAYAYDEARRKLVVFGGLGADLLRRSNVLEWDGARGTWLDRDPIVSPTSRYGAAMAYDSSRRVSVMFGGTDASGFVSDTWTWDGEHWTPISPILSPSRRINHAMVYDSRRRRVILFGGRVPGPGLLDETWQFDGTSWMQLTPPVSPPPRENAMMAYDPLRDQVVLVGGDMGPSLRDTWIFDGTTWTAAVMAPSNRTGGTLTFDPVRGGLVAAGGTGTNPTLLWDGSSWQVVGPSMGTPLTSRNDHVAYFDPDRGTVVAGLGRIPPGTYLADMHQLDGDTWTAIPDEPAPTDHTSVMTYDAGRGRIVMFGGNNGTGDQDKTWELAGSSWVQRIVSPRPSRRDHAGIAYDRRRGKTVVFGGDASDPRVWEWDGTVWTAIPATTPAPAIRSHHEMAYDEVAGVTVLFGGMDAGSVRLADTWTWDGTTWTDVTTATAPSPRISFGLAYDPARREVILFGGVDVTTRRLGDTWAWTLATGWVERQPVSAPSPRSGHALASDPIRGELVMLGGTLLTVPLAEAWTWNGLTWARVFSAAGVPPEIHAAMAYDPSHGQMIRFGSAGTWRMRWSGAVNDDACALAIDLDGDGLVGCADPDCAARCSPSCPVGTSCATGPACGDAACDPLETCRLCPADCGACTPRCGDAVCDPGEVCPGDCP